MGDNERQTDGEILERTRQETKKPELFKVLLLNDDYTTMEFVVEILENVFHKQPAEAYPDHDGGAHAGEGPLRRLSARSGRDEGRDRHRPGAREWLPAPRGDGTGMTADASLTP